MLGRLRFFLERSLERLTVLGQRGRADETRRAHQLVHQPARLGSILAQSTPDLIGRVVMPLSNLGTWEWNGSDWANVGGTPRYGVSAVAIRRGERLLPNPGGTTVIEPDDLLVLLGLAEEIAAVTPLVRGENVEGTLV